MPKIFPKLGALAAGLLLAIPALVAGAVIGETSPAVHQLVERAPISSVSPNITDKNWINGVLSRHDLWRQNHAAAPLVWSSTLATYAQTQANKCLLQHSGGQYGENIYWISSSAIDFYSQMKAGTDAWGNEVSLYDPNNPYNEPALHFTALVWKGARRVGCAWTSSTCTNNMGGFYFFCEYDPVTNVVGQFAENVTP